MIKKLLIGVLGFLLLLGGFYAWKIFRPAISNSGDHYFYIKSGESIGTVKENLVYSEKINGSHFNLVAKLLKYKTPKPGRYKLTDGMSMYKLVKLLRSGTQEPEKVVIVKERTTELFAGRIGRKYDLEFDSLQMIRFMNSNDSLKPFGVDTNTVLTIVMPYTYEVKWNSTPGKMFSQFRDAWERFWTAERKQKAEKRNLTPVQVSILASIVEEETNRKADRYNIASVYLNRLKEGMRLEADPTVKFITRNFSLGRIQGIHLKLESPYNTYLNKGLPPGPICTPSIEAIEAVLDAPDTAYLFFVASHKFDGSTVFTTNFDDHRKYVRLFHAEQRRRSDSIKKARAIVNDTAR